MKNLYLPASLLVPSSVSGSVFPARISSTISVCLGKLTKVCLSHCNIPSKKKKKRLETLLTLGILLLWKDQDLLLSAEQAQSF